MNYSIRPKKHELREARQTVQNALEACKTLSKTGENLDIDLGSSNDRYTREEMEGATGFTPAPDRMELEFNTEAENWRETLKIRTVEEYGHALYLQKTGKSIELNWQDLLYEAYAAAFTKKALPETETPKASRYTEEQLAQNWDELREKLQDKVDADRSFIYGKNKETSMIGLSLAHSIAQELLKENELEEITELERQDILETGDDLFG